MIQKGDRIIKSNSYFRFVLKITTEQLIESDWNLTMELDEAKKTGCLISLAESTCIRMIEDVVGVDREWSKEALGFYRGRISELRKQSRTTEQVRELRDLYKRCDAIQYLPEYVCLVCGNKAEFKKACKGFYLNGLRYERLVGTTGGVKNSTVVFLATTTRNGKPLLDEIRRRIDNGRDLTKEFVPAKFEAYRALVCSASSPLSDPYGVLVVDDCVTHFRSSFLRLADSESDEPELTFVEDEEVELIDSDGYGLMSPSLAQAWKQDLHLHYLPAGLCLRNSFCKGMVFTFDFHEFAEEVAGNYIVKDIWGHEHDIRNIDLILTASMLKLWDSYGSIDEYLENCHANGYCFAATKVTAEHLDDERRLNYQFIQSYRLSDDEVWELIEPTLTELTDVMGDDYAKTLLFLRGTELSADNAWSMDTPWVTALMVEPGLIHDPYIKNQIKTLVKKKVREAKFGKIKVKGNFSVISGDPYALCQSIWGHPVKGLLQAGELYNKYWVDNGEGEYVACFRAPMSSHHNIKKLKVVSRWSAEHWYQYMNTVTVLNAWDMTTHALNGADKDGDLIFLTDNRVLVDNVRDVPVVQCEQKKAVKCVPSDDDLMKANALGFGDEIGAITNRITAMTELQSMFKEDSEEYKELQYRITSGQHLQQNSIDPASSL